MKKILFFANTSHIEAVYTQMFFVNTIALLEDLGYNVIVTNRISDSIKYDYDAIFNYFYKRGVFASIIAKLRRKKVFFTGGLDDLDVNYATKFRYIRQVFIFKICRWLADWCLVESHADLNNIHKICIFKNHKNLYYSPQAADLKKYRAKIEDKENVFSTICWLGEVSNPIRKGVDTALYYFKYLTGFEEFRDARFYIMGRDGKARSYIEDIIKKLELQNNVIITGEVTEEEKIQILGKSRYFFQLSKTEGFGLAALEALASSCIPIHSGKGGLKDVIASDGVLIDIDNFDYSIDTVDTTVYDRLKNVTEGDINKMLERIYQTFDISVRKRNFKNTIVNSMENV